ncbi:MAG TPA: hypothetical protein V6C97_31750, partial [Oculatellaceae cyanobacterium]
MVTQVVPGIRTQILRRTASALPDCGSVFNITDGATLEPTAKTGAAEALDVIREARSEHPLAHGVQYYIDAQGNMGAVTSDNVKYQ